MGADGMERHNGPTCSAAWAYVILIITGWLMHSVPGCVCGCVCVCERLSVLFDGDVCHFGEKHAA